MGPLYLTHDDENWAPVVLQGKHDDGTVDYEMKYTTDFDGEGATWFLSQEPVVATYDPVRKCEIWMPSLFTEEQLHLWRRCKWERICAQEGIRKRNQLAAFVPGAYVEASVAYPKATSWCGMVMAVNEDGTYFVANHHTSVGAIPEGLLRPLPPDDVTQ